MGAECCLWSGLWRSRGSDPGEDIESRWSSRVRDYRCVAEEVAQDRPISGALIASFLPGAMSGLACLIAFFLV
jgi:hypothetical protein